MCQKILWWKKIYIYVFLEHISLNIMNQVNKMLNECVFFPDSCFSNLSLCLCSSSDLPFPAADPVRPPPGPLLFWPAAPSAPDGQDWKQELATSAGIFPLHSSIWTRHSLANIFRDWGVLSALEDAILLPFSSVLWWKMLVRMSLFTDENIHPFRDENSPGSF